MNMDTEKEPSTSDVTPNSSITLGIAGENIADPVGLNCQHNLQTGTSAKPTALWEGESTLRKRVKRS